MKGQTETRLLGTRW